MDGASCVQAEGPKPDFLEITKGVTKGSIVSLSFFFNNKGIQTKIHLPADGTIVDMSVLNASETKFVTLSESYEF